MRQTNSSTDDGSRICVIYNGACSICGPEVAYYQKAIGDDERANVVFKDIAEDDDPFSANTKYFRRFHVRIEHSEEELSGLPAFIILWQRIPRLRWLARVSSLPVIYQIGCAVYDYVLAPLLYRRFIRSLR